MCEFLKIIGFSLILLAIVGCDLLFEADTYMPRPKLVRRNRVKRQAKSCGVNEFRCSNGVCLQQTDLCNGFFDCGDDSESDETSETCHNRTCPSTRFRCSTGGCIHMNKICDGFKSCVSEEDDAVEFCKNRTCPEDRKFRCDFGTCISQNKVCNGKKLCKDGSDEAPSLCKKGCQKGQFTCSSGGCISEDKKCDGLCECTNCEDEDYEVCKNYQCPSTKYRCLDGRCIHKYQLCDGVSQCDNSGDETWALCQNNTCAADKFRCDYGACLNKGLVCDGWKHCKDGGDEAPSLCQNKQCPSDKFRCKSGGCLARKHVCDGYKHCLDGADETAETCKNMTCKEFQCQYGGCLRNVQVCDGYRNCMDGTDESWEKCHTKTCGQDYFQCKYGGCLKKIYLCDGTAHCFDGSDESSEICPKHTCAANEFRCNNGICIASSRKCNGQQDCKDGSDESELLCKISSSTTSCILPPITQDSDYTVLCPDEEKMCGHFPGEQISEFSQLHFTCNEGYSRTNGERFVTSCSEGKWEPKIEKCSKICPPLKPFGVDLKCWQHRKGPEISCNGVLLEGNAVRPTCKTHYHPKYTVDYTHITCQSDGNWNRDLYQCVPDCGKTFGDSVNLIAHGTPERRGESPWNVAIYSTLGGPIPEFICGGTIISEDLIVSAAHCFYENEPQDAKYFQIAVAKMTRNYTSRIRGEIPGFYNISKIFFNPDVVYTGSPTHFAADIAILRTSQKITFNPSVLPACVYWSDTSRFNPPSNAEGKLVGFGDDENANPSVNLLVGYMPFISYADCRATVHEDFRDDISIDKFCAGKYQGAGARNGDSGGGLLFHDSRSGFYYLRGIVSNRDGTPGRKSSSVATFTDITQYVEWIKRVRQEVENERMVS